MPASVLITLIICVTALIICLVPRLTPSEWATLSKRESRLGRYKMLLEALSELHQNIESKKAWRRLTTAINLICLECPGRIVEEVVLVHDKLRKTRAPLPPEDARRLLILLRQDMGTHDAAHELNKFHIVPVGPSGKNTEQNI